MADQDTGTTPYKRIGRFRVDELSEIVSLHKRYTQAENRPVKESLDLIAERMGRSPEVIKQVIRRFRPAVDGAEAYLKAQSLRLAMRVVRKANVDQSIDVLSRSNIGVLAPKTEGGSTGGGFFLSVQAEHLGAVGIVAGSMPQSMVMGHNLLGNPSNVLDTQSSTPPSEPYSGSSGMAEMAETTGEAQEAQDGEPDIIEIVEEARPKPRRGSKEMLPGVPHDTQNTFGRKGLSERQRRDIQSYKEKLTARRREVALARNRKVEV